MKNQFIRIKSIEHATHDVLHLKTEKPEGLDFTPGQATELIIDKPDWQNEGRPFTFVGLPREDHLEFMIKTYPAHKGVTNKLLDLKAGDELILNDVFGAIAYKGEGVFIAGGAGVTPFISIFRDLKDKNKTGSNKLIFANKSESDIILKEEFQEMLGDNFINILSEEKTENYLNGQISEEFLKRNGVAAADYVYLCGPPPMMEAVEKQLIAIGFDQEKIVMEEF